MKKRLYCIGIGGIGVSSLAQYYLAEGWEVSGSDDKQTETTKTLEKLGANITIGTNVDGLKQADLVVYTNALPADHPELVAAKQANIPTKNYPEALGELTKKHYTVAVAGTHGKSTTTSMVALIFIAAGLDPTVIVGTKLEELGWSNFRQGKSKYLIIEADEYKGAFWNYQSDVAVILNVDVDHLDFYHDLADTQNSFRKFLANTKPGGTIILNGQDTNTTALLDEVDQSGRKVVLYNEHDLAHHKLEVPGAHNQSNAEAAAQAALAAGIDGKIIEEALSKFHGTWRRFEKVGERIYSDYAHHPEEVQATLKAAREYFPNNKLIAVFQPDGKHRLNQLFDRFTKAFDTADETYIVPTIVKLGREKDEGRGSEELVAAINKPNVYYIATVEEAYQKVLPEVHDGAVVFFMGSGDIDSHLRPLLH